MPSQLHDRLRDVQGNIRVIRGQLTKTRERQREARAALVGLKVADPREMLDSAEAQRFEAVNAEEAQLRGRLEEWMKAESECLSVISGTSVNQLGVPGYNAFADPDVQARFQRLAQNPDVAIGGPTDIGGLVSAQELGDSFGSQLRPMAAITDTAAPELREGTRVPITPQLNLPVRFIDLIPSVTRTEVGQGKQHTYTTESGNIDTAVEVAEGAVSPEAGITLTDAVCTYQTIRHFIKATREQLADTEELQDRLRARLVAGVLDRVELQTIQGDGTGSNLKGLLRYSTLTVTGAAASAVDVIRTAIRDVELSGAVPNFVALSIGDDAAIDLLRESTGGGYLAGGAFAGGPGTLWGRQRVTIPRLTAGTALVGATMVDGVPACRIVIREGVNLLMSDADQDDFLRRKVTLHAAARVGLEVQYPQAFCRVTLS